jgi:hypothetical protein
VETSGDLSLSSGERPLPVLSAKRVDIVGTLDDDMTLKDDTLLNDTTLKRVIGRSSTGRLASMRRVPPRNDVSTSPRAPSSPQATPPTAPPTPEQPRRRASIRVRLGAAGVLVALAGLALWRASGSGQGAPAASSPSGATPRGEAPLASAPATVAIVEPVASADRPPPPPPSAQPTGRGALRPAPVASHATPPATPSAAPSAQVVATATPAPTQAPPPAPPRPDPLSDRE